MHLDLLHTGWFESSYSLLKRNGCFIKIFEGKLHVCLKVRLCIEVSSFRILPFICLFSLECLFLELFYSPLAGINLLSYQCVFLHFKPYESNNFTIRERNVGESVFRECLIDLY